MFLCSLWSCVLCISLPFSVHLILNVFLTVIQIFWYVWLCVSLSRRALLTLVRALIVSKLVLAGIPGQLQDRLQSVLNAAARLVFSARRSERITPLLGELHWLRVLERVTFRLCVLACRCLHGTAPAYLAASLHRTSAVDTRRRSRSADSTMLVLPSTRRSTLGDRAFSVASSVRNAPSLTMFCRKLKTVLFWSSFDND